MEIKKVLFDIYYTDLTDAAKKRYCDTYKIKSEDVSENSPFPIAQAEGCVEIPEVDKTKMTELTEELGVEEVLVGPMFEIWKLSTKGVEYDELVTDAPASIEDAKRYAAERGITSTDDYEAVIEEVYEVRDEPEGETYFKARARETI